MYVVLYFPPHTMRLWSKKKDQKLKKRKYKGQDSRHLNDLWELSYEGNEYIGLKKLSSSNPFFLLLLSAISWIRWPMANWPDDKSFSLKFILRSLLALVQPVQNENNQTDLVFRLQIIETQRNDSFHICVWPLPNREFSGKKRTSHFVTKISRHYFRSFDYLVFVCLYIFPFLRSKMKWKSVCSLLPLYNYFFFRNMEFA